MDRSAEEEEQEESQRKQQTLESDEYIIRLRDHPTVVLEWLKRRRYRVALMGLPSSGGGGVIFQKTPREPPHMAIIGDTLKYYPDHDHVVVFGPNDRKEYV